MRPGLLSRHAISARCCLRHSCGKSASVIHGSSRSMLSMMPRQQARLDGTEVIALEQAHYPREVVVVVDVALRGGCAGSDPVRPEAEIEEVVEPTAP